MYVTNLFSKDMWPFSGQQDMWPKANALWCLKEGTGLSTRKHLTNFHNIDHLHA